MPALYTRWKEYKQLKIFLIINRFVLYYLLADNNIDYILRSILNFLVILICALSFLLCIRAIIRAQQLKYVSLLFNITLICLYNTRLLWKCNHCWWMLILFECVKPVIFVRFDDYQSRSWDLQHRNERTLRKLGSLRIFCQCVRNNFLNINYFSEP